jgi:hypothetical protein
MTTEPSQGGPRKPGEHGKALLAVCPVCARGEVKALAEPESDTYVCVHCGSRVSETILGFVFKTVNETYVRRPEAVKNKAFTKAQLFQLSAQAASSGASAFGEAGQPPPKTKPSPPPRPRPAEAEPPPPPPPPEAQEPAKAEPPVDGKALLRELAEGGSEAGAAADEGGEDIWWEVDEEELAKRQAAGPAQAKDKAAPENKPAGPSVDDLLDDIGKGKDKDA